VRPWLGGQLGWYRVDGEFDGYSIDDDEDRALVFDLNDDVRRTDDSFGINLGGGIDVPINQRVSLGIDVRYHNAFNAFDDFEFVTTMLNVSIWFGDEATPEANAQQ